MTDENVDKIITLMEEYDFETALEEARAFLRVTEDPKKKAELYLLVSSLSELVGDRETYGSALFGALAIFRTLGNVEEVAHTLILIGRAQLESDLVDEGINYCVEALKIALHNEEIYRVQLPLITQVLGNAFSERDPWLSAEFRKFGSRIEKEYGKED